MTPTRAQEERRSWAVLLLVSGPALQVGGWLAAFTDIGAVFVRGGTAMPIGGFVAKAAPVDCHRRRFGRTGGGWGWLLWMFSR